MKQIDCMEIYEVEFTREGAIFREEEVGELETRLARGDVTDLIVMSHGWNNDMAEARYLYSTFFTEYCAQLKKSPPPAGRTFVALTVLWPSKKFADRDLIPGGGAGVSSLAEEGMAKALDTLREFFGDSDDFDKAAREFRRMDDDEKAQRNFVDLLRSKVSRHAATEREDGLQHLFNQPGDEILRRLQRPLATKVTRSEAGSGAVAAAHFSDADSTDAAAVRGAGLGDTLRGMQGAGLRLANLITYYAMKDRAGTVGTKGLNPLLQRLSKAAPNISLHLVGHSFGGRLVTATAAADRLTNLRSMSLLQAAFSHYGFAANWEPGQNGMFRNVLDAHRVNGPILVTQSVQDLAVGVAYAIASKLSGTIGAAVADAPVMAAGITDRITKMAGAGLRMIMGGPNDKYGGIGRNGALALGPNEGTKINPIHPVGQPYDFSGARVFNLICDDCIRDHGDICQPAVVYAVLQAESRT